MPFCNKQLLSPENGAQLQFLLNVSLVVAAWVLVLSACEGRGAAGSVSELREAEMKMVFLIDFQEAGLCGGSSAGSLRSATSRHKRN